MFRSRFFNLGPGSWDYGNYRMSFSRSDASAKKHMARVSDLYRERVKSVKTVLFFIVSVSLLSVETVLTKWRPCQDTVMTTPAVTVENQEKAI